MDSFIAWFNEYKVAWMLVFFAGVLFWAFRSRFRRPPKN
jgi:cbb3-type cytochrome oxidase subunit 3